MFYLLLILMMQEEAAPAPPPVVDVPAVIAAGKEAFLRGDFEAAVEILQPAVDQNVGEAMLLAADALYGINTPQTLRRARHLYERCVYEDDTIPFADHSLFQAAKIYFWESDGADDVFQAREYEEEAAFYLKRLVRKFPDSFYVEQAQSALLDLAIASRDYDAMTERAMAVWNTSTDPANLSRAEPFAFIQNAPETQDIAQVDAVFRRHEPFIRTVPPLIDAYAVQFEQAGDLIRAAELFLTAYNLYPDQTGGAGPLLRLADLHMRRNDWTAAAFLYARIIESFPGSESEALAAVGLARMMERGDFVFVVEEAQPEVTFDSIARQADPPPTYVELLDIIRYSPIDPGIRAEFAYRLAVLKARYGDGEQALLILRNLLDEYRRGRFIGLYRGFYEQLLFTTLETRFNAGAYWDLDRLYRRHQQFLAFTTQTRYPTMVAQAYLALDLPSSAVQVFEDLWSYKNSITGFDLAFEEPLLQSLELFNVMRLDDRLGTRLDEYNALYRRNMRFGDRFDLVRTLYDSRAMEPDAFLDAAQDQDRNVNSLQDARRLRRIAIIAQEQNRLDMANDLYLALENWASLKTEIPDLWREIKLFQADRFFSLANYFEAERRYRTILADQAFPEAERDWSYLQVAKLHELKGEAKQALRIYGQIAYSQDPDARPYQIYASRRLAGIAAQRRLDELEKELAVGAF